MYSSEYLRLNCQIYRLFFETSKYNGMKNLAIQNRVLQRDRVLERRVLERYYCNQNYGNQIYCELNLLALRYIYDNQIVVRFYIIAFTLMNVFCYLPPVAEAKRSRIINNCTINIIVTVQIRNIRLSDMKFLPSCDQFANE